MDVPSFEFDILIEKNARKKYTCPMCKEILVFAVKTNCNHRFCKYCISKWMMHFDDCPACGQKIQSTAPHPRTDKWIQQLFDLATSEFREDREMCVNYRKLQQVKLELTRGDEMKQTQRLNKDDLLDEFNIDKLRRSKKTGSTNMMNSKSPSSNTNFLKTSEPLSSSSATTTTIGVSHNNVDIIKTNIENNNNNNNNPSNICKINEYNHDNENDVPSLFTKREPNISIALLMKNTFSLESSSHPSQIRFGEDDTRYGSDDVTSLFGVGGIDIHNHSSTDFRQLLSYSSPDLIRVKDDNDDEETGQGQDEKGKRKVEMFKGKEQGSTNGNLNDSGRGDWKENSETAATEEVFPLSYNSARTFSVHFPDGEEREGPKSRLFTLAELTCHDELVFVGDHDNNEPNEDSKKGDSPTKSSKNRLRNNIGDGDRISDGRLVQKANIDNLDSAETAQMNLLKAESMRARIQHEICMASLPSLSPARHSTHSFSGISKQPGGGGGGMSTATTIVPTPTNGNTSSSSSSQKENQDLQTCRDALLNLRLRLLPPTKKTPKGEVTSISSSPLKELNKRINSDAQIRSNSSSFSSVGGPKGKLKNLP